MKCYDPAIVNHNQRCCKCYPMFNLTANTFFSLLGFLEQKSRAAVPYLASNYAVNVLYFHEVLYSWALSLISLEIKSHVSVKTASTNQSGISTSSLIHSLKPGFT